MTDDFHSRRAEGDDSEKKRHRRRGNNDRKDRHPEDKTPKQRPERQRTEDETESKRHVDDRKEKRNGDKNTGGHGDNGDNDVKYRARPNTAELREVLKEDEEQAVKKYEPDPEEQHEPTKAQDGSLHTWQEGQSLAHTNMYMLTYEIACDVVLVVGESKKPMRAHKYMLMSRSSEFYKMLSNRLEDHPAVLHFPDVDPKDMREVLSYLYNGSIKMDMNKAYSVLHAARKFNLRDIVDEAMSYLQDEMYSENVCRLLEVAHEHELHTVYDRCLKFIHVNAVDVLISKGFTELCVKCVEHVIKLDNLRADEIFVFEAMLRWADAECARQKIQPDDKNRRAVLGDLIFGIRFPTIDINYVTQKLSTSKLLTADEKLSLFQYHHGKDNSMLSTHFNTNPRISNYHTPVALEKEKTFSKPNSMAIAKQTFSGDPFIQRVHRFDDISGDWRHIGTDAISFKCSKSIYFHGVIIYGPAREEDTYKVIVSITDDMKRALGTNQFTISTNAHQKTYDIILTSAIRVQSNSLITVEIVIRGRASYRGVKGKNGVEVDGIHFVFISSNRSSNGTDVTMGQIPGLLYSLV